MFKCSNVWHETSTIVSEMFSGGYASAMEISLISVWCIFSTLCCNAGCWIKIFAAHVGSTRLNCGTEPPCGPLFVKTWSLPAPLSTSTYSTIFCSVLFGKFRFIFFACTEPRIRQWNLCGTRSSQFYLFINSWIILGNLFTAPPAYLPASAHGGDPAETWINLLVSLHASSIEFLVVK